MANPREAIEGDPDLTKLDGIMEMITAVPWTTEEPTRPVLVAEFTNPIVAEDLAHFFCKTGLTTQVLIRTYVSALTEGMSDDSFVIYHLDDHTHDRGTLDQMVAVGFSGGNRPRLLILCRKTRRQRTSSSTQVCESTLIG